MADVLLWFFFLGFAVLFLPIRLDRKLLFARVLAVAFLGAIVFAIAWNFALGAASRIAVGLTEDSVIRARIADAILSKLISGTHQSLAFAAFLLLGVGASGWEKMIADSKRLVDQKTKHDA